MKVKRILAAALGAIMLISSSSALSGCGAPGGEKVSTVIHDKGKDYRAEGTDEMTVKKLIDDSGVTISDKDEVTPSLDAVWKDAKADGITIKRYAKVKVVCDGNTKEVELVGGTVAQALEKAGYSTVGYQFDADAAAFLEDGMTINVKKILKGRVEENGKVYYYSDNGELMKNTVVGSDSEGYSYADANGVIDPKFTGTVNVDGGDWNIINGKAKKVVTDADKTLSAAIKAVTAYITPDMSKEEKLKACFEHIKSDYIERVPRTPATHDAGWEVLYANDILVDGAGDCYSYGAAFAFLAKAAGCDKCFACNSGGHGWAEVEGKVYDAEWSMHHNEYTYFGLSYDDETDVNYKRGISPGADWMRVEVVF